MYSQYSSEDQAQGVLEGVISQLDVMLEDPEAVDVITFIEGKQYLNQPLYPRQRLIFKIYYKMELTSYPCWCQEVHSRPPEWIPPEPEVCRSCGGTGIYDEFEDAKKLLACENKYAQVWVPGLCRHHLIGSCDNPICQGAGLEPEKALEMLADYRRLSDEEIRARLRGHWAQILGVCAGRRGGKSVFMSATNGYGLYMLLRLPDPHKSWGILGTPIGTRNVATEEGQAKIVLEGVKALMKNSPWFQRLPYKAFEVSIDFTGRNVKAQCYHSNSASIRGQSSIYVFLDEFWHFNKTVGKLSDRAMKAALFPSVLLFGTAAKIVWVSSPLNRAGVCWEYMDAAQKRLTTSAIVFQLATWEMNPAIGRNSKIIQDEYKLDPRTAEMEYGAQIAEQVGVYLLPERIVRCAENAVNKFSLSRAKKGQKYALHIDMAKKFDRVGLAITWWDKELRKVCTARIEEFDPTDLHNPLRNNLGEINVEAVFEYICQLHDLYGFKFNSITLDQFESQWLIQALRKKFNDPDGNFVQVLSATQKFNNEVYGNLRSLINQGGIEFPLYFPLIKELKLLTTTMKPSGAFKVEAPLGEHDDLADALRVSAYMSLVMANLINSRIVVVKETEAELARKSSSLALEPVDGVKHSKGCKPEECRWGCPARRRQKELTLGVRHHPDCTIHYCDMMCPVARMQ